MGPEAQILILKLIRLCQPGNSAAQFSGLRRKKFLLEEIAIKLERGRRVRGENGEGAGLKIVFTKL